MQRFVSYHILLSRFFLFLFLLFQSRPASSQVSFYYNEIPIAIPDSSLSFYLDSSQQHEWSRFQAIQRQMNSYPEKKFSLSYTNQMAWLRIRLDKIQPGRPAYLMIRNPHINYLRVWLLKDDSLVKSFPFTGDRLPFYNRAIHHPDFLFPVPDSATGKYSMIIMADKRNELLALPVHFLSENGLLNYNLKKNLFAGLITGLSIFLFFFNLFLFFQMRERLYVYYGLYILMGLFYIFSDYGYSFMYLFPDHPYLADYMRPISISLATPLYLHFCLEMLAIKKEMPRIYRYMSAGLILYFVIFISSIPFMGNGGYIRVFLQNLMQFLLTILVIANLVMAIIAWRKKIRFAIYIVLSSLLLFISISFFVFYISGYIADTMFTRNLMNIGFAGEISLLAFTLSLRFKHYKELSEALLRKSSLQQEQIFKSVSDYQEQELQRLSSLLHDSIGARLSALRLKLESGKSQNHTSGKTPFAISEIAEIADEIRRYSHGLSPVLLQKRGLRESIQLFIKPINESGQLFIQFEMIGSLERNSFRYELLTYTIIQELVQNIIKHAAAREAIVQLLQEDNIVSIYAEDNGRGFSPSKINEGLGFSQIRQLIKFVNGRLMIDSAEGNGTRVSIEFTKLPDAGNQTNTDR